MSLLFFRYIAIVHPIQAHIVCSRRRMIAVIASIWPAVLIMASPVVLFNRLVISRLRTDHGPVFFCVLRFPLSHHHSLIVYKYMEFFVYYLVPLLIQVVCYIVIGRRLFAGSAQLHRKQTVTNEDGVSRQKTSDTIRQRKGVVKMLIASVIIYFLSYSPHQLLLFYNTFSQRPFHQTWITLVSVTAMGYVNSAANPVLYCIFSQNFRSKFLVLFCLRKCVRPRQTVNNSTMMSTDSTFTKYSRVPQRSEFLMKSVANNRT